MFSPSHTRISQSQAFRLFVDLSQIPKCAAVHLQALQYKLPGNCSSYVIVSASICRQLAFGLNALVIEVADHRISGIPALDRSWTA